MKTQKALKEGQKKWTISGAAVVSVRVGLGEYVSEEQTQHLLILADGGSLYAPDFMIFDSRRDADGALR